jgi:uncharacterized protein YvpB
LLQVVNDFVLLTSLNYENIASSGWHVEDGRRFYRFPDGNTAQGVVEINGVTVAFGEQGEWLSSRLDVPYISQLPDMPFGCEVVSVTMMLNYAGISASKEEVAALLPYANDPNEGFTGSLYDVVYPGYYGYNGYGGYGGIIWPPALLDLVRGFCGSAVDLTEQPWETVRASIDQGKPVCVWFSRASSGALDHTVLLTGYSDTTVWFNDPLERKDATLDLDAFLLYWEQNGYRALSY